MPRGRPTRFGKLMTELHTSNHRHIKSERGKRDLLYRYRALGVLLEYADFDHAYLFDREKESSTIPDSRYWKPKVLSALGAIKDDAVLLEVARAICEQKFTTTAECLDAIRRCRETGII
jgi:hypothetical protein